MSNDVVKGLLEVIGKLKSEIATLSKEVREMKEKDKSQEELRAVIPNITSKLERLREVEALDSPEMSQAVSKVLADWRRSKEERSS